MGSPLTSANRAWVAKAVGPGARVLRSRALVGGITSAVNACVVETFDGARHTVVMRRWLPTEWDGQWENSASERVSREAATLSQLPASGVPSPMLIAADPSGDFNDGVPTLLMSRVPGHVDLTPRDPTAWIRQLAHVLPHIHASTMLAPEFGSYLDRSSLVPPAWSKHPEVWERAISVAADGGPYDPVFTHRDFQHFNVLWSRGRLTGVIDWPGATMGPADIDVGHCRLNLAIVFSTAVAEEFRLAYEAAAGRRMDPVWDVHSLLNYLPGWGSFIQVQAGTRRVVDLAGMHGRVDELMAIAMARL